MCQITFYTSHDESGDSQTFTSPQARNSGLMSGIDSLQVTANTWVIAYNNSDFTGDYLQITTNNDDLNDTPRGSHDWKNQIKSFVMFDKEPPFWNNPSEKPYLPTLADHQLLFCEDENYTNDNALFTASTGLTRDEPDLNERTYDTDSSRDMKNNISSLALGPNAWAVVFDQTNFLGNSLRIYPAGSPIPDSNAANTPVPDLNAVTRGDSGDWKNQIQSFVLYASCPASWSMNFDLNTFNSLFPDAKSVTKSAGDAIEYEVADSTYRIYNPQISANPQTPDLLSLSIKMDHDVNGATDDHVEFLANFDTTGTLVSITDFSWDAGGTFAISDGVIAAVDSTAYSIALLAAVETDGGSLEVAQDFVDDFDTLCKIFNDTFKFIALFTDNGGRFYFIPVICHTVNRLCAAISVS